MPMTRFNFPGHDGGQLAARLDMPDGPHLATALFAHCFTCSKDIPAARRVAARLASMGIAVLRFDFTGLGHSDGEFENTTFTTNVQDLQAACAELSKRGIAPSLLIGHSLGGAAVLKAASTLPDIKAVVTIGAPSDPGHVTHNFGSKVDEIASEGVAEVCLAGRPFRISSAFLDDVAGVHLNAAIASLDAALLVLHAPLDETVSVDNASNIFVAAKHPKSFVTLDDADHLLTRAEDAEYAADVIASWVTRYLDLAPQTPPEDAPEGVLRVAEGDPKGFLQDIQSGPHHILADEPTAYGGSNKGLTPYGLVSAGLGACTSMTIRMYARRKEWPLEHVSVDITHDKIHGQDAGSESDTKIDQFTRVITLKGDLDDKQRARLLEIADRCPVHRTLERSNHIETKLA